MSDFSEICPLFNTGVLNELYLSDVGQGISHTLCSVTANRLEGSITAGVVGCAGISFGRTVVVTDAFWRKKETNAQADVWCLQHRTTIAAAHTAFASFAIAVTLSAHGIAAWNAFDSVTDKTFTSNEILGVGIVTATTAGTLGMVDLIIRYKEA